MSHSHHRTIRTRDHADESARDLCFSTEANPVMAVTAVKATGSDVQAASSTPVAAG